MAQNAQASPGCCARCGTPILLVCKRCMQYVCRICAAADLACSHLLVRLTVAQVDRLMHLPVSLHGIKGLHRATYLCLQRKGLAWPDPGTLMLRAKLADPQEKRS